MGEDFEDEMKRQDKGGGAMRQGDRPATIRDEKRAGLDNTIEQ
jgi:hypothetical protein